MINNGKLSLICILVISLLVACNTLKFEPTQVTLSKQASYVIQGVPTELIGHTSLQKLQVSENNNIHEFLLQTELQKDSINMVGLSFSGIQLFQLTWQQGQDLIIKKSLGMPDIPAKQLLTYYQLSTWPINSVKKGLVGLTVSANDPNSRQFFENQSLFYSVTTTEKTSTVVHHKNNYQITIETLD
ncbi:DUF3261 domain-containing protein [Paraglaciecola sp. 2405UD69-4]|uniref:DUF3261 domain-containing protein n=1 Tax=Paraglaciecola sp. 2405UD69-4 TaxID=3391836 RepID=UPI0039C931A0